MDSALAPDTTATLLLCGRFGKPEQSTLSPLGLQEYNRLVAWLAQHAMRPADLLGLPADDLQSLDLPIAGDRLLALLRRGGVLALAVESWESKGLWIISRSDEAYPARLQKLGPQAPPLLYGAGEQALLSADGPALAIVGSRDVDNAGMEFTRTVARAAARQGITVVSGGARGVDSQAMLEAVDAGGLVTGVLADSLASQAVKGASRKALADEQMVLLSPYDPDSGFNVGNAMGRNKLVYSLANAALVISCSAGSGGTWAGAEEALKKGYAPVFVRLEEPVPEGNLGLLEIGAHAFPEEACNDLARWLAKGASPAAPEEQVIQGQLW